MAHEELDWRPDGAMETYRGMEVWEYNVGPHQLTEGEVDGEVDLSEVVDDD
ncbi:MAG: hypothetical protein ABEH47_03545 [Haloferacaceae archaeon]